MNAARFARHLIEDGVDPKLAQPLAEHLADEIERTVATKEHVEMVVTREVQQLRVEMHQEFRRSNAEMSQRLDTFQAQIAQRLDTFQAQVTQRLDGQMRWLTTSTIVLFLAMLGNILKDFLR
jgi:DNA anti-recombination protein RmuC